LHILLFFFVICLIIINYGPWEFKEGHIIRRVFGFSVALSATIFVINQVFDYIKEIIRYPLKTFEDDPGCFVFFILGIGWLIFVFISYFY
jgi:hypothetical protein